MAAAPPSVSTKTETTSVQRDPDEIEVVKESEGLVVAKISSVEDKKSRYDGYYKAGLVGVVLALVITGTFIGLCAKHAQIGSHGFTIGWRVCAGAFGVVSIASLSLFGVSDYKDHKKAKEKEKSLLQEAILV